MIIYPTVVAALICESSFGPSLFRKLLSGYRAILTGGCEILTKMTITKEGVFVSDEQFEPERLGDSERFLSIGHLVFESLTGEDLADLVIFVDAASGREWTGAQLKDKILSVATALIDLHDFKRGTCVSIDYDHSDYTVILALAVIACGGVVACAFPKDPYAELLYMARKTEPKFLFCHRKNIGWSKQLSQDLGYEVIGYVMDGKPVDNEFHFQKLLGYDHSMSPSRKLVPVACENRDLDLAFIIMSSGTTGQPKAIPVTHSAVIADLFGTMKANSPQINMSFTASLDYVSGRLVMMGAIRSGYRAIIMNGFEPKILLEAIERYKINVLFLGAAAFYNFMTYKELDKYDISSLMVAFPMGAKITYLDELKVFLEKHPHIKFLRQGYGTSEFSGAAVNKLTPEQYLKDCDNSGKLMQGVQAKIVDPHTGKILGPNEKGEVRIKGPTLFPGYYDVSKNRARNGSSENGSSMSPFLRDSSVFDEDGFYITGDLAMFNDNEEIYILGRSKELLSCRGSKKVLPDELEILLLKHPAVCKACVVGMPNKLEPTLHCPRAYVVPTACCYDESAQLPLTQNSDKFPTREQLQYKGTHKLCSLPVERRRKLSEDIMEFSNERIGWEKQLTGGIVLIDEIPILRETGKMNKSYLKSLSLEQIEIFGDRSEG